MKPDFERSCTAFAGSKKIAQGDVAEVASKAKRLLSKEPEASILIFDDLTSAQVEIDFRGSPETVARRLEKLAPPEDSRPSGPGRPKLGVVSREIGLLPKHWDWLALQPGGASSALRRLVEDAQKKYETRDKLRRSQDAAYRFMTVMAGDLPAYEEALRALYARDQAAFKALTAAWPKDIREHARFLAQECFA